MSNKRLAPRCPGRCCVSVIAFGLVACSVPGPLRTITPTPPATPPAAATPLPSPVSGLGLEDYAVYDAVIQANWPSQAQIVLESPTATQYMADMRGYVFGQMTGLQAQTGDAFLAVNQVSDTLTNRFQTPSRLVLLSRADKDKLFGRDLQAGWRNFHAAFSAAPGLLAFSRVGFNVNRSQALVYFQNGNGGLDAVGYMVLLGRASGVWVITKQFLIWIA